MRWRWTLALAAPILLLTPAAVAQKRAQSKAQPVRVDASLVQLIAAPASFDGKTVRVQGFIELGFEHDALYLHREDFEQGLTHNAVWIELPAELQMNKESVRYVTVEGVFHADQHGHLGQFSGAISVTRISPVIKKVSPGPSQ